MDSLQMAPVEFEAAARMRGETARLLMAGDVIILRNADAVRKVRTALIEYAESEHPGARDELVDFYERGKLPSLQSILGLSHAIKAARDQRLVSQCFAPLIAEMGFSSPIRLDGGIPRLVLPTNVVDEARDSGLFANEDFQRVRADGPTEVFMPKPANIHRDYNRAHYLFQCNFWFPLHNLDETEVLRIYPQHYRSPIFDTDATEENLRAIGEPLRYTLRFGDVIVFHGEHLHTSPASDGTGRRRQTYDLRVASQSLDDTRHYRDFFLDLRNFCHDLGHVARLEDNIHASESDDHALPALLRIEQHEVLSKDELVRLCDIFDRAPFSEDRYLILANRAQSDAPAVASRALQNIVTNSPHWFWVAEAGKCLTALGDKAGATDAFSRAVRLAERQTELPNFMPVQYVNPPTQPLPENVRRYCEQVLGEIANQT